MSDKIKYLSHQELKEKTSACVAVIRTGECSPYSNIILEMGVDF
ncbi:RbsD/FucU domain-containing protein [Spiroplasma clarkii]|nr:RbsD/FucU domain-containing protein [Spiroplasma clarkii]